MALIKLGEAIAIRQEDIQNIDNLMSDADLQVEDRMRKLAQTLKTIAPHASDFLYFTAVMMHAAEASILDDAGEIKKHADGTPLSVKWEPVGRDGGIRWVCSDENVRPYKNANADIFPEAELKKAYKKWIGRPLCLDHKSSSVDMIRGVIVDTYWDERRKRIIALCALDKKNYPDLARKVASGYATNVSMGTAVGRAVCTEHGCHKSARMESEFCDHMRKKSCYGEINLDLSPIELSLVVTGADPRAKVKHIIAKDLSATNDAVNALQNYLDGKIALAGAEDSEVEYIKEELKKLTERVEKLTKSLEEDDGDKNDVNYGTTGSTHEMKELETDMKPAYNGPADIPVFASELQRMILDSRTKLASISENLEKLSLSSSNEGKSMTQKTVKAYWQGTEEPKPGQLQYPIDPLNEYNRENTDKQMVGKAPFPGVGDVDGMYPGNFDGESEVERKKRLQRLAEVERRAEIRRRALADATQKLESRGYFQGTEEPKPGQKQYPIDPLNEHNREEEDKQMVGQPPFPGVGDIDGLHPSPASVKEKDELKRKQMLSRAKLNAKFRKVSKPSGGIDKSASRWDIYADDQLILSASVSDITRGNAETLYDAIATADFGRSILGKITAEGFDKAKASLIKSAQNAPVAVPGPGMPANEPPAANDAGGELPADLAGDAGGGEEEVAGNLEDKIDDTMTDLQELVSQLVEGGKKTELEAGELGDVKPVEADSFGATASLSGMRKTVNGLLNDGIKEAVATLNAHITELSTAKEVCEDKFASFTPKQKAYFAGLVDKAVSEAHKTASDSLMLMSAFVKYAHATHKVKTAQVEETPSSNQIVTPADVGGPTDPWSQAMRSGETEAKVVNTLGHSGPVPVVVDSGDCDMSYAKDKDKDEDKEDKDEKKEKKEDKKDDDKNDADVTVSVPDTTPVGSIPGAKPVMASKFDLTTKQGRAMYRAKLAQQGLEFSPMLDEAHPQGGHTPGNLDTKPTGDLAKVETLDEVSKAINDLANMPPKVRKQAQEIATLVQAGKLAKSDVDGLAAYGVDKDAIKYYKQYWAEAKDADANEFASKLVEEHTKAKTASEVEKQTVKIKLAYDLAYQMRDRGMIESSQIPQQVSEILSWNDEGYKSVKSIVAKHESLSKQASIPQVGLLHSGDVILPSAVPAGQTAATTELQALLDARWSKGRF